MNTTDNLFRVIAGSDLALAQASGMVPRCASDQRSGCIHLNLRRDVETVAGMYFSAEEEPVVLEIRRSDIESRVAVLAAVPGKPWEQLTLHQPNILMSSVVAVHRLEALESGDGVSFRWEQPPGDPSASSTP